MNNSEKRQICQSENSLTEIFRYEMEGGVSEYHVMIHATRRDDTYEEQLKAVTDAYHRLREDKLHGAVAVFKRYFLSDAANQADVLLALTAESSDCALSVVEQPPLDGTKISLWAYLLTDVRTQVLHNGLFEARHGAYRHLWGGSAFNRAANSEYQTRLLLNEYVMQLMDQGCKLADNCIRTWFFVQNVDVNYAGVVKARNEVFVTQNLTEKTHYIASTGIGGRHADPKVTVQMDTYAVDGLKPGQIRFLYAPTHLNPTYEYGVSFERGTYVDYGDRRHVFISGTASINNKGEVVHPGNIRKQTERMWENVETLLKEADCTFDDLGQIIVYLRDIADYTVVKQMYDNRFPTVPMVFVHAPVCRPGWLIEMECMGVKALENKEFAPY
ncbi:Rid family hydrolase [Bacteroides zoogleoformans]|uniref:Rid family hydrolase n=1 Tax=Bacteroides zoogleoformans TaxID=28119 RepID=UPI00248E9CFA|nr:Rid family hydrolase [Bacteroides zoogleoformans]